MSLKLSTKCRYGSRAIVEIAKNFEKMPTKRKDIAKTQGISDSYLEDILIPLKNAGLITAIRGAKGGFRLARAPHEINLLHVITALDGPICTVECLCYSGSCERSGKCVTRSVWKRVQDAQEDVLREVTLQDLIDEDAKLAV